LEIGFSAQAEKLGPWLRAGAAVLFMTMLGACGQTAQLKNPPALYTVTAMVMQKPGDPPRACSFLPLPEPPIGCGGPAVRGVDLLTMPGITRYRNGVMDAGILRLVGTWDGQALSLTRSPETATVHDATPVPLLPCPTTTAQPEPGVVPPQVKQVRDDEALLKSHGIQVLEFGACGDSLVMTVVVADSATVDFLIKRYPGIQVAGWLKRVS
jgi:hypothetical protein